MLQGYLPANTHTHRHTDLVFHKQVCAHLQQIHTQYVPTDFKHDKYIKMALFFIIFFKNERINLPVAAL